MTEEKPCFYKIPLKPGLQSWGRNGLFQADSIEIFRARNFGRFEIFSKRIGKHAPISVSTENINTLHEAFAQAVKYLEILMNDGDEKITCPICGKTNVETKDGGFIEIGEWDGTHYTEEFDVNGHHCLDCNKRFWMEE